MSQSATKLVVATSGRHIIIYDLRNLAVGAEPLQRRESSLKYQTRCIRIYPDDTGIISIISMLCVQYIICLNIFNLHKYF